MSESETEFGVDREQHQLNLGRFKRTILMVDHDRESIDSLSSWFEREGYEIKPTFHPLYGLTMAAEQKFDAAVVDIQMADMNGMEFLRELVGLKSFPVIVLTHKEEPELNEHVAAIGAFACFVKPTEMSGLKATIEKSISDFSTDE